MRHLQYVNMVKSECITTTTTTTTTTRTTTFKLIDRDSRGKKDAKPHPDVMLLLFYALVVFLRNNCLRNRAIDQ